MREAGEKPIKDDDGQNKPQGGNQVEKTESKTDPDSGMFVKDEHERQFAYKAHTACERHGFILGVEITAGNVHDSVAWDAIYDAVTRKYDVQFVTMDAGYKPPRLRETLDDGKFPFSRILDIKERKTNTGRGSILTTLRQIHTPALAAVFSGTPPQAMMRNTPTEALPPVAEIVHVSPNAEQMKKGRKCSKPTSGRNTWTLWKGCERQSVGTQFMQSARKP